MNYFQFKINMRCLSIFIILLGCTKIAVAQFSITNWAAGAYYDTKGIKHAGLLTWKAPDQDTEVPESAIYFKARAQSNEIKIPAIEVSRFVVERDKFDDLDSFIVSKNLLFSRKPIIEVIVCRNAIKLYRSIVFVMSKAVRWSDGRITPAYKVLQFDYYFGPDDEHLTQLDDRNFEQMMPIIMSDNVEAITMVKNKEVDFKDITTLIHAYKHNGLPPVSAPAPLKKTGQ
ncbi:hypothetical protein [Pedobacter sp. Hv1]|uniref:hypothetical protein n=1 Tax=Pedobacter sp. Hv1 TaxID=1740090 RepID=UPI0006D8B03D|nr:hypothetical protein [Pedobacter sp. Hv1]KQC02190.1 hypothetical protein AQF98_01040 [Pedobacter sp. Hv1]